MTLKKLVETAKANPAITSTSGVLVGAVMAYLLSGLGEVEKQDTAIMSQLGDLSRQVTISMERQDQVLGRVEELFSRLGDTRKRVDLLAENQEDLRKNQITLQGQYYSIIAKSAVARTQEESDVARVTAEILALQREGRKDVWLSRGPPYARTDVLQDRIGKKVSAELRDRAALSTLLIWSR